MHAQTAVVELLILPSGLFPRFRFNKERQMPEVRKLSIEELKVVQAGLFVVVAAGRLILNKGKVDLQKLRKDTQKVVDIGQSILKEAEEETDETLDDLEN